MSLRLMLPFFWACPRPVFAFPTAQLRVNKTASWPGSGRRWGSVWEGGVSSFSAFIFSHSSLTITGRPATPRKRAHGSLTHAAHQQFRPTKKGLTALFCWYATRTITHVTPLKATAPNVRSVCRSQQLTCGLPHRPLLCRKYA